MWYCGGHASAGPRHQSGGRLRLAGDETLCLMTMSGMKFLLPRVFSCGMELVAASPRVYHARHAWPRQQMG